MQIVLKSYKSFDPNGEKLNKYLCDNMSNWNAKNYSSAKISIDINPTSLL